MTRNILSQIHIAKDSNTPIYKQLQEQLERLIANDAWRPREPLPSETSLAQTLNISVMTVRQAMAQLVHKGLIYREKGRGTFVTPKPLDHHLHRLEGFSEDMHARALVPSSQVLVFEIEPAPKPIAQQLELDKDSSVLHLKRLRLADDRPVALHDAYLRPLDLTREELDEFGSLYLLLEHKGIRLTSGEETLEAVAASGEIARLLHVSRGAPLLKATRLTRDHTYTPVEIVIALFRADFYRYTVKLER
jgi:GntR family transcriptional regulator